MRHFVICGQSGSVFFPHYLKNGTSLGKTLLLIIKSVFLFSLRHLSEIFLILRRIQRDMIKNIYIGLHAKYPLFLSDFNATRIFSTDFRKILKYEISRKSIQWETSCSKRTDGHMTKLIIAFRSFAKETNYSTSQRSCSSTNYSTSQRSCSSTNYSTSQRSCSSTNYSTSQRICSSTNYSSTQSIFFTSLSNARIQTSAVFT
jgi:hypothetical protein